MAAAIGKGCEVRLNGDIFPWELLSSANEKMLLVHCRARDFSSYIILFQCFAIVSYLNSDDKNH
jgi:hypothetical protein